MKSIQVYEGNGINRNSGFLVTYRFFDGGHPHWVEAISDNVAYKGVANRDNALVMRMDVAESVCAKLNSIDDSTGRRWLAEVVPE